MHLRVVAISDTHGTLPDLPEGDLLIVAGDFTINGTEREVVFFDEWLGTLPHPVKVVVAGNHDWCLQTKRQKPGWPWIHNAVYLQDSGVSIPPERFDLQGYNHQITIYGSPWQPRYYDWAFQLDYNSPELKAKWEAVPTGIDILVTHAAPYGILDEHPRRGHLGCEFLAEELKRIKPKLHVFGHIHPGYGVLETRDTLFVNASVMDGRGFAEGADPTVIDLQLPDD